MHFTFWKILFRPIDQQCYAIQDKNILTIYNIVDILYNLLKVIFERHAVNTSFKFSFIDVKFFIGHFIHFLQIKLHSKFT